MRKAPPSAMVREEVENVLREGVEAESGLLSTGVSPYFRISSQVNPWSSEHVWPRIPPASEEAIEAFGRGVLFGGNLFEVAFHQIDLVEGRSAFGAWDTLPDRDVILLRRKPLTLLGDEEVYERLRRIAVSVPSKIAAGWYMAGTPSSGRTPTGYCPLASPCWTCPLASTTEGSFADPPSTLRGRESVGSAGENARAPG